MTASAFGVEKLPHRPPMRLIEEITDIVEGESVRCRRWARPGDWYFQGHFPGDPVVPAIVLIEMLAQAGGLAAMSGPASGDSGASLRVAAVGPFKFPGTARPNQVLDAHARVVGHIGGMIKIEGDVLADGVRVASGSVTLARVSGQNPPADATA